jgi:hypothetical protein
MESILLPEELAKYRARHEHVYVIVSPPRCSSTAFARVFWEQPSVRYYYHEPFETTYYMGDGLPEVVAKLDAPLDLTTIKHYAADTNAHALVIKEMPYQVGERFPLLATLATKPLVFLLRDPRLNIASRRKKKIEVGDSPLYPFVESGWNLLAQQIDGCRRAGIEYLLVDSGDFRNQPEAVFPQVLERLGLPWSPECLVWEACEDVELDNLEGAHRHLYGEVLASTGLKPDPAEMPALDAFPEEDGVREHVARCLEIYRELRQSPERIRPAAQPALSSSSSG